MEYDVYYKGNKCKVYNNNICYNVFQYTKGRHIWPEDNTEITLSYNSSNNRLYFTITNLSDRAQYLSDYGLLGVGLFVDERHSRLSVHWISESAQLNHPNRRCMGIQEDPGLSGYFDLDDTDFAMSDALARYFQMQADYEDDPAYSGTDTFYVGIGRYAGPDIGFRPFKMSEGTVLTRYNPYVEIEK